MAEPSRIDVWLFNVRFYKSRSLAADAVQGGLVHLNGARVKPAHGIKPGDTISFRRGSVDFECEVLSLPLRRGPGPAAQACYRESATSAARREQHAENMRLAAASGATPGHRPTRQQRAELRRLRGRY
ncbi:MAG: RNA-binding S4 domain-containing protein [Chromatiales bacterium]|jgi:ribosome-associated heat shock protein Hsp15|nr:RNA-binding S4 domain-containing protein [Chromatiales bacterium]